MAKHLYSPRISDVWKSVEAQLDADEALTPHMKAVLAGAISRLEERDQELEDAILGDLIVNGVDGSVGALPTSQARQIGWSANFGFVNTTCDASGNIAVVYNTPFSSDTACVMIQATLAPMPLVSYLPVFVPGSATKTGFTANIPAISQPIAFCYGAIGF